MLACGGCESRTVVCRVDLCTAYVCVYWLFISKSDVSRLRPVHRPRGQAQLGLAWVCESPASIKPKGSWGECDVRVPTYGFTTWLYLGEGNCLQDGLREDFLHFIAAPTGAALGSAQVLLP